MLKAGLLPSPIITPLSNSIPASKNKIDTQTFVEIRSEVNNVKLYFTVDGSKPDPFQPFRTGHVSTYLYRGAFRLGPGRRVVKAVGVSTDGLRESHITTKFFDVNDIYGEVYSDENEASMELVEHIEPIKPLKNGHIRSHSANPMRTNISSTERDDSYHVEGSIEGPISPINYSGTQVNVWGIPAGRWTDDLMNVADSNKQSQFGYMTEQMLQRLQQEQNKPLPAPPVHIIEMTDPDDFWNREPSPLSAGDGYWKKTLEHIFLHMYDHVKKEQPLREAFGWKRFARIENIRVVDKGTHYEIVSGFKKPLGEQVCPPEPEPTPRPRPKPNKRPKPRPSNSENERPIRKPAPRPPPSRSPTPPRQPSRSPTPPPQREIEEPSRNSTPEPRTYEEETVQNGTLVPFPDFNVENDCKNLQKAMKGLGTDDKMLINILGNRSNEQRVKIRDQYKLMFGRELASDIKGDTSGDYGKVLKNLLYSSVEYDCRELKRAMRGAGTDEEALIEILASRSKKRLSEIKRTYEEIYSTTLEKDISSDTSRDLKKILLGFLDDSRPESNTVNEDQAESDAQALYKAGEKKWGTDEKVFVEIISTRSNAQLKAIFNAYSNISKKTLDQAIKSETSGDLKDVLLAIVRVMQSRPLFFAHQLKKALKGAGTDEDELNRVIISRCEVDMIEIKQEYETLMKRSLEKHVESDTSGNYRKILLELLKDPERRSKSDDKYSNVDLAGYQQPEIYKEDIIQQGTLPAAPNFDANRDSDALRKAMKGLGTDEKTIINILGNRNTAQRLKIKAAFKSRENRDLVADLKSETSGNFCKLLERLMMDPVELDCFELKQAVKGIGTDEETLIEILASRSNERIRSIAERYEELYNKALEKDVKSDTSGNFRCLLVSLLQGKRPETVEVNVGEAKTDAQALFDAGQAKFGTDESTFNNLLCNRSDPQLRAIFKEYAVLSGKAIEETIKSETSGDLQRGLTAIVRCVRSRPHFFAEQLRKSMKGAGTKESTLNRVVITRSEIDLVQIKAAFTNSFSRELTRDVSSETSGDYKKLLLELLKDPSERSY